MSTYTNKERELEKTLILSSLAKVINQVGTIQVNVQSVAISAALYSFKNRSDLSVVEKVLNGLTNVKGSFRVESVAHWFTEIAGIAATVKDNIWTVRLNKDESVFGVKFTYDKEHLARCKESQFRFWLIAPVKLKELKLAEEVEKVTSSAEIQLARSLAAGKIGEEEIAQHLANMLSRIKQLANSGKTKEFLEEFYAQHPDQKPLEQQLADELQDEESALSLSDEVIVETTDEV